MSRPRRRMCPTSTAVAMTVAATLRLEHRSAASIARATGIPAATLNRRLNCHKPFLVTELWQIAQELGMNVSDLVGPADGLLAQEIRA